MSDQMDQAQEYREPTREEAELLRELLQTAEFKVYHLILQSLLEGYLNDAINGEGWDTIYEARGGYKALQRLHNRALEVVASLDEEKEDG